MSDPLLLSQYKIATFEACQRRFQLGFVERVVWPDSPTSDSVTKALACGKAFHKLLEQHYLDLRVDVPAAGTDAKLLRWWQHFQQSPPMVPNGARHPEISLSVPVGEHLLFGRIDLLVLGDGFAHIFDWKTERKPRSEADLRAAWQTKVYLAMIAEGGEGLGRVYSPSQISLTYWFAADPAKSVTFRYDDEWHQQNWAELSALSTRIERRLQNPDAIWPLSADIEPCRRCRFAPLCGRLIEREETDFSQWNGQMEDGVQETAADSSMPQAR